MVANTALSWCPEDLCRLNDTFICLTYHFCCKKNTKEKNKSRFFPSKWNLTQDTPDDLHCQKPKYNGQVKAKKRTSIIAL